MRKQFLLLAVIGLLVMSCNSNEDITRDDRLKNQYESIIGVRIDSKHFWKTAINMNVDIVADDPSETITVEANSIGMSVKTLFDRKDIKGSGTVTLTLPQGVGNHAEISVKCSHHKKVKTISFTGNLTQNVSFDLRENLGYDTRAATNIKLIGTSNLGGQYYNDITFEAWNDVMGIVSLESSDPSTRNEIVNYELVSNGKFEITFITGMGASMDPHTVGYYYHSPGTYSDTKLVDIAECQINDYLTDPTKEEAGPQAKTQYMLNKPYTTAFGNTLYPDRWYDSNFDIGDDPGNVSSLPNPERRGDDAYNSILVWKNMSNSISRIRGLTFVVDVPVGMHLGFYLRLDEERCINQFNRLVKMGMPDNIFPPIFTGYNFSAQAFNYSSGNKKKHKSMIHEFDNFTFMGMENIFDGGDYDCNDIVFGMTATDMDMVMPDVINPDIDTSEDPEINPMTWTLAFEDVFREADYDFNDAVIRLIPDYENEKCKVEAMACGTEAKMYLHFDGPEGDICLGELHELMVGQKGNTSKINTLSENLTTNRVSLGTIAWPKNYSMINDAKRFYIEVKRGDCNECSDVITLPDEPGKMPEAILIAGDWKWPREGVKITETYSRFEPWIQNVADMSVWNWYALPKNNTFVNY